MMRLIVLQSICVAALAVVIFGMAPVLSRYSIMIVFILLCAYAYMFRDTQWELVWLMPFSLIADVIWGTKFGLHAVYFLFTSFAFLLVVVQLSSLHNTKKFLLTLYAIVVSSLSTALYTILNNKNLSFMEDRWEILTIVVVGSVIFPTVLHFAPWWTRMWRVKKFTSDFKRHS